jgi:hypothetical protein
MKVVDEFKEKGFGNILLFIICYFKLFFKF